jgi:hypothetical protein
MFGSLLPRDGCMAMLRDGNRVRSKPAGVGVEGTAIVPVEVLGNPQPTEAADEYEAAAATVEARQFKDKSAAAAFLAPELWRRLAGMPARTYDETRALAKWANAELRRFGLAIKCPKTGRPSALLADPGGKPGIGRFQLLNVDLNGKKARTLSAQELPSLDLMPSMAAMVWVGGETNTWEANTWIDRSEGSSQVVPGASDDAIISVGSDSFRAGQPGQLPGDERDRFAAALKGLPEHYRSAMELILSDIPAAEIANKLNISENEVVLRKLRAMKLLRQALGYGDDGNKIHDVNEVVITCNTGHVVGEGTPVSYETRRALKAWAESMPGPRSTGYEGIRNELAAANHSVRAVLAKRLEHELNARIHPMPHETLEQKKELAQWVNDELKPLGLAVQCPNTGLPAKLRATTAHWPRVGRFYYEVQIEGKHEKSAYSDSLPELKLVDVAPSKEPEAKWQGSVGPKETRRGRRR